ncbi:MAG TPA: hypothetical protein VKB93_14150, partial [Thermoanaerobaculia bacterium]|nr:hypothetical protein [Thermoanaerobaculia bacterium]
MKLPAAIAVGLAYGIVGQIFFALAAFGALTRISALLILIPFALLIRARPSPFILIASLPAFVLALYPPAGWDATAYHLVYARLFANAHALVFADTLRFPVFPQLGEMHFAAALLVANDAVAQLTQWLALVVTAAALLLICGEKRGGIFAVALWLGNPIAVYLGANGYIDMTLTMSVTLAFGAWLLWRSTGASMWIALTGAFAGMAAATKYHGLFFVLAFVVAIPWRKLWLYATPAALFAVPWYARIAYETGNPVFPFFGRIFGRSEWRPYVERNPAELLAIPTDPLIAAVRRAYLEPLAHGTPPFSPWLALLLPLAIAAAVLERRLRFPLAVSAVWILLMTPLDWRFMLPVIPLLCAAIALILERLVPWRAFALALLAPGFLWGTILIAKYGLPRSRDAFLARRIPVYRALQFTGNNTVYVLNGENGAYYCRGRCLGALLGP